MNLLRCLLLFLLLTGGFGGARAATVFVEMRAATFVPASITINQGDTVTWTNRSGTHDTVSDTRVWSSSLFSARGTFSFTFDVPPGVYPYFCTPHRSIGMVGTVAVRPPPNLPPTISIVSPAPNSRFLTTDDIVVVVQAADPDGRVDEVDLLVGGRVVQSKTQQFGQFSINLADAGTYELSVRAIDNHNARTLSAPVSVQVDPNLPPVVAVTSPGDGGQFTAPVTLVLEATATDDRGVVRVEFLVNGVVVGSDAEAPFALSQTFGSGTYSIVARASEGSGQNADSAPVVVNVTDPIPAAPEVVVIGPLNGADVPFAETIELSMRVTDPDDAIVRVEFLEGAISLGVASAPIGSVYSLAVALAEGRHTITVQATDASGKIGVSSPFAFIVVKAPSLTSQELLPGGSVLLGAFGSSGIPYVFEASSNLLTWTPFRTNVLFRRVLFVEDTGARGQLVRFYRMRAQ